MNAFVSNSSSQCIPLHLPGAAAEAPSFQEILSSVQLNGITTGDLANLAPKIASLSALERLQLLTASKTGDRANPPVFIELANLDVESQTAITAGIISDLVKRGLYLDTEDYLAIPPQAYDARVHALRTLTQGTIAEANELAPLTHALDFHERQEQRLLLQYLTKEEMERVQKTMNDPRIPQIGHLISNSQWEELFKDYAGIEKSTELSYILIGAYCQKYINLEDLATALMFNRVFCNTQEGQRQILPITEGLIDEMGNLSAKDKLDIFQAVQKTRANQRFLILIKREAFDPISFVFLFNTFLGGRNKGILSLLKRGLGDSLDNIELGTFSFGVSNAHYGNLSPVIHLTPTMEVMADHLRLGRSDFVLHFPDENAQVHGCCDKTILAQVHDLLHTHARYKRGDLGSKIQELLLVRIKRIQVDLVLREKYSLKMNDGKGQNNPSFIQMPTMDEMVACLLDRVAGVIVDGGYRYVYYEDASLAKNVDMIFQDLVEEVIETEFGALKRMHQKAARNEALQKIEHDSEEACAYQLNQALLQSPGPDLTHYRNLVTVLLYHKLSTWEVF